MDHGIDVSGIVFYNRYFHFGRKIIKKYAQVHTRANFFFYYFMKTSIS